MGNVANDPAQSRGELSDSPDTPDSAAGQRGTAQRPVEHLGVCVRDILRLPAFAEVTVVAGAAGLDRRVERANVMEVPDIIAWVKPRELLMTTGYPLRDAPQGLAELVRALDSAGVSALAVKLRRYLDDLPRDMIDAADAAGFPVLLLPDDVSFDDLLTEVVGKVLQGESSLAERNEAIGRALVSVVLQGGGLDELAEALHAEIGGLSFVHDSRWAGACGRSRPRLRGVDRRQRSLRRDGAIPLRAVRSRRASGRRAVGVRRRSDGRAGRPRTARRRPPRP